MRQIVQAVCGLAVIAAFGFSWLWTISFINRLRIAHDREKYRLEQFIVTGAEYHGGPWLNGTIRLRSERFVPRFNGTSSPQSRDALLALYPVGTRIEVLYNPEATETLWQGESLRVLPVSVTFGEDEARLRRQLGWRVLAPVPLTLALYFIVSYANRRHARLHPNLSSAPDSSTNQSGDTTPVTPEGFSVISSGDGWYTIRHKRTGMGCMTTFLAACLAGWSVGCVGLFYQYLNKRESIWFVLFFWGVEVMIASFLAYHLFNKKSFIIDPGFLKIESELFGFKQTFVVPKSTIKRFVQVKDGGEGDDSFPSWGLNVEAEKNVALLFRQPYETSEWLGRMLAQWASVEYTPAKKE